MCKENPEKKLKIKIYSLYSATRMNSFIRHSCKYVILIFCNIKIILCDVDFISEKTLFGRIPNISSPINVNQV